MPKRILVGVDGSERTESIVKTAIELAGALGGRLLLVRAVGLPTDLPEDAFSASPEAVKTLLLHLAHERLAAIGASVPQELLERIEVEVGSPWQVLCSIAKKERVDLLIIGTHGYSGLDHLLGTTATRVVNHAPCSVFIVRTA